MPDLTDARLYLAGPMRGYPLHNFPAFEEARGWLRSRGADVFCPAEYDLQHGFDPARSCEEQGFDVEAALRHDLEVIAGDRTGVVFLRGSSRSAGALAEFEVAHVLGLRTFAYLPIASSAADRVVELDPDVLAEMVDALRHGSQATPEDIIRRCRVPSPHRLAPGA